MNLVLFLERRIFMNGLIVALFAFFGGMVRFFLGSELPHWGDFPLGTLVANFIGCFIFSWLVKQIMTKKQVNGRLILGVGTGFCGALTTFSSFALDTVQLLQKQAYGMAVGYFVLSIFGGLFFVWLGEVLLRKRVDL
jgi:CrcB protein